VTEFQKARVQMQSAHFLDAGTIHISGVVFVIVELCRNALFDNSPKKYWRGVGSEGGGADAKLIF